MKESSSYNKESFSYDRISYIDRIESFVGKPVIKVLTGMRRAGKSVLLQQIRRHLLNKAVKAGAIFFVDKESLEFESIATHRDLERETLRRLAKRKGYKCLIVDEVQEISDWERSVVSLMKIPGLDIFLSGSNAQMLSSELATLISGRYIEIPVYPLGFDEFLKFRGAKTEQRRAELATYLRYGGLPGIHHFPLTDTVVYQYIRSVYDTILLKDVIKHYQVRHIVLLENIVRYICDNLGNLFSANRIADYLKSQKLKIGVETVLQYTSYLEAARLLFRARRFDIKGKRHLELMQKLYLGDIGLRHALLGFREGELSGVLENVVYLELNRRGYQVNVGKLAEKEIDFIATKENRKIYVQVAYSVSSQQTIKREFGSLLMVDDNYPKYVVSLDDTFGSDHQGIKRWHLMDFLLDKREFS